MTLPFLRILPATILFAFLIDGSCQQQPIVSQPDTPLLAPGGQVVELTAAAIPPGGTQCSNGSVLIASWWNLFSLDLATGQVKDITYNLPTPTTEAAPGELYEIKGDPQMARLKDGSVVLIRQGFTRAPFKGPTPAWASFNNGKRGLLFIWRTVDCGEKWEVYHPIDLQDVLGGKCAWPQTHGFGGGFDRSELYADPWNGNLYLSTLCRGGTEPQFSSHYFQMNLLFTLRPGDSEWRAPLEIPVVGIPPLVMTSNKSGRLWLFHCDFSERGRYYISDNQGDSLILSSGWELQVDGTWPSDEINRCSGVGSEKLAGHQAVLAQDYSLSRAGDAGIRVAFPRVENGRQVLQIVAITDDAGRLRTMRVVTFEAEWPDASIIQHSFVESDRVDRKEESNLAALYWLESSPSSNKIQVRFPSIACSLLAQRRNRRAFR